MVPTKAENIDEYIAGFPKEIQEKLNLIRETIRKAAPDAEEKISYAMPTYILYGNLVHFGAFKHHIGFYPIPTGIEAFQKALSNYKVSKGSVQFPFDKPIPVDLIRKIVNFRVKENIGKAEKKNSLKTCKMGHKYYKTSDCPTCPVCERERKPSDNFLSLLSAPARRALEHHGVLTLQQLSGKTEKEILQFHGLGKASIPTLSKALAEVGLTFRK